MVKKLTFALSAEGAFGLLFGILAWVAEINWIERAILVLICFALVIHIAWRLHEKILIRASIMTSGIVAVIVVTWHPIYQGAQTLFSPPPFVTDSSKHSSYNESKIISTVASTYLRCHYPKRQDAMPFAQAKDRFRIYGQTIGVASDLSATPGGLKLTFTPTEKSSLRFGVTKSLSIKLRRSGEDVMVDIESELPGALAILGMIPEHPKKPDPWESAIEQLLRAENGSCRVL